ncbi:MAG TPA: type II secretion system protein [Candidatus Saccharimonadales bacterium]|nr:type II secretion system protein [Candidatus Saccharimonadales bacterium]
MLSKLRKSKEEQGFTIIEVLIVLAIAGLILLIVFLAVPNLQRNSRNTQRKDDVSRIGSAVQEFINNNNGTSPTAADSATIQNLTGKMAYFTAANVTVVGNAPAAVTNNTTVDTVNIYTQAVCGTNAGNQGATSTGSTTRSIAIVYSTENSTATPTKLCTSE